MLRKRNANGRFVQRTAEVEEPNEMVIRTTTGKGFLSDIRNIFNLYTEIH